MAKSEIFVGRKEELEEFMRVLENPQGQAIIVVGNRGMGKTWLVNRMAKRASEHPTLKCGWVRYEVTPTDSPDSTMAIMMDNAFEAGQVKEGSFDGTKRGLEQWRSFLNVFNLGDLILSLQRDPAKNTRQQFLERLELISGRMPENGRAIFIVDPEKYMAKDSDQTWAIVVKGLPEKIKFIFAQRSEDVLVDSDVIDGLDNVVRVPSKTLETLSEEDVDELVNCRRENLRVEISDLRKILSRYKGHPYAIGAALDMVEQGTKLEELPKTGKPTEFAAKQWGKIGGKGDEAIKLFEAYAILEVAVPDDIVESVSGLNTTTRKRLQNDKYLRGLLRDEAGGRRIYHSMLADYIFGQMSEEEKKEYNKRAVEVYRGKLSKAEKEQTKPDELAAVRLPEHVLSAGGEDAFVDAFVNECTGVLLILGLLDEALSLSVRALGMVEKDSEEQAMVLGNLGQVYQIRGELNKAEEALKKALRIDKRIGCMKNIAGDFDNLGLLYIKKGKLDKAEEFLNKSLKLHKKIGQLDGIASDYRNLGLIYKTRGELDKAEEMHKKALGIDEMIVSPKGISCDYGNLGVIYGMRGELDKAKEMFQKTLEIDERIGWLEGIASSYCSFGQIYRKEGRLEKAEEMYKKSLTIAEKIGVQEGIAIQCYNLGMIYEERGDLGMAREYGEKARDLYKKIGMPNEVKMVEGMDILN
ncbi:MAG: tetratricopeptide repeat protein [Sedimentisphaerales bacterium]|nr:tetratricopeptide repeat protein [Sedimentisphaerales bacterium]